MEDGCWWSYPTPFNPPRPQSTNQMGQCWGPAPTPWLEPLEQCWEEIWPGNRAGSLRRIVLEDSFRITITIIYYNYLFPPSFHNHAMLILSCHLTHQFQCYQESPAPATSWAKRVIIWHEVSFLPKSKKICFFHVFFKFVLLCCCCFHVLFMFFFRCVFSFALVFAGFPRGWSINERSTMANEKCPPKKKRNEKLKIKCGNENMYSKDWWYPKQDMIQKNSRLEPVCGSKFLRILCKCFKHRNKKVYEGNWLHIRCLLTFYITEIP